MDTHEGKTRHQFQRELRALSDEQFDELYVRLRGFARYLLSSMSGPLVRLLDPPDLVHDAYLRVETGASASSSAPALFWHLAKLMQRKVQKVAKRGANRSPHLTIVTGETTDVSMISADAFEAPPSDDPLQLSIAAQRLRQILSYFAGKGTLLRYIRHRLEYPGATAEQYAVLMDVDVETIRNMNRVLRRGLHALREQS